MSEQGSISAGIRMFHNVPDVKITGLKYCVQPIAERLAQNLESVSKTFNFVPGVPGFS